MLPNAEILLMLVICVVAEWHGVKYLSFSKLMPVCLCREKHYPVQEHGSFKEQLICQAEPA